MAVTSRERKGHVPSLVRVVTEGGPRSLDGYKTLQKTAAVASHVAGKKIEGYTRNDAVSVLISAKRPNKVRSTMGILDSRRDQRCSAGQILADGRPSWIRMTVTIPSNNQLVRATN